MATKTLIVTLAVLFLTAPTYASYDHAGYMGTTITKEVRHAKKQPRSEYRASRSDPRSSRRHVSRGKALHRSAVQLAAVRRPSVASTSGYSLSAGMPRFIRGRLVCAINVNAALASQGRRGTGSATARSFLGWGRATTAVPGAVAVYSRGRRGGHVAIVSRVDEKGRVWVLNPSTRRQAWVETVYNRSAIAYRI